MPDKRRIRGFYISDEEKVYLERYLAVIKECPEEKKRSVICTVDAYFNHGRDKNKEKGG